VGDSLLLVKDSWQWPTDFSPERKPFLVFNQKDSPKNLGKIPKEMIVSAFMTAWIMAAILHILEKENYFSNLSG
jgi:hypothetical protein